jgi:hypothetical protein
MTRIAGAGRVSFSPVKHIDPFGAFALFGCRCMPRFFLAMLNRARSTFERCYSRDATYDDRGAAVSAIDIVLALVAGLDFRFVDYVSGASAALNALIE